MEPIGDGAWAADAPNTIEIGEALRGLAISALPDGWTPVDAVCVIKCLNEAGEPLWVLRPTRSVNEEELLGTLIIQTEVLKRDLLESWADE